MLSASLIKVWYRRRLYVLGFGFGFGLRIRKDSDSRNRGFVSALEERLDNLRKKGRENLLVCLVNLQKEQEEKTG